MKLGDYFERETKKAGYRPNCLEKIVMAIGKLHSKKCLSQLKTEKGCDEKDVKSKGGSQGLCRNAVDHIKNFDSNDPGRKTFFLPQCFAPWVIILM